MSVNTLVQEKEIIRKYLGIPFQHGGRGMDGLDCWGLILAVYQDLGYRLFDITASYERHWSKSGKNYFIENYHKDWKKAAEPKLFDGVLFINGRRVDHAGIVVSEGRFIHSAEKSGVVTSRLQDWEDRIEGFYHLKARDDSD